MNKFNKYVFVFSILILSFLIYSNSDRNGQSNIDLIYTFSDEVENYFSNMTLDEKVGQLFMIGGLGRDELQSDIVYNKYKIGNIFLGSYDLNGLNEKSLKEFINTIQNKSKRFIGINSLISIDQEGGLVNRLSFLLGKVPSQQYVSQNLSLNETEKFAVSIGAYLNELGINTNFSPVADITKNPNNILEKQKRIFSSDPYIVADYSIKYLESYRQEGVVGCMKHFPGYGRVQIDPHISLPTTDVTLSQLRNIELIPYKSAIKYNSVDLIMTSHICYPSIDGKEGIPASLSKKILTDILRYELLYDGVVVTDDMNMGAILELYNNNVKDAAIQAIEAGVNILLYVYKSENYKKSWQAIYDKASVDTEFLKKVNLSVKRILALKIKYNLL